MKKKRITYGVAGMMEWQAVIKIGRSRMKVTFADGSATGYGMNPAMYTTDNLMVQKAIENSDHYKRGLIYIVNSTDLDEDVAVLRNEEPEAAKAAPAERNDGKSEADALAMAEEAEAAPAERQEMIEMEFDNNDDAKDYLEREFGCNRSKLHNRADIMAAGEANGVRISFS